jgi:glycosyltransferase involved in cell wall biosynthesis
MSMKTDMDRFRLIKSILPRPVHRSLSVLRRKERFYQRWLSILLGGNPAPGQVRVFYGYDHVPRPGEPVRGGMVKFQRMQHLFPNSSRRFNILYLGSSSLPADWSQLLRLARRKKARLVINQNGVGYPAWYGPGWDEFNRPMATLLHAADFVFYQSQFCKLSADQFLGKRDGPSEILYNAVDTHTFTPAESDPDPNHLVLLLGGNQYESYRLEVALQTLALVVRERTNVRLLITGRLNWIPDEVEATRIAYRLMNKLNITNRVEFLGPYSQQDAPAIYQKAHLLLHIKYNDPCPGAVIEAMACGLPVVYSHSGGVPELVEDKAGIGIQTKQSWEQIFPPDPNLLAKAILSLAEQRTEYAEVARQRAVEYFDLQPWLQRHREVFEELFQTVK